MIAFQKVNKRYDAVHVLDRVSFEIHPQEVAGLSGASGAGKTTMLRLIAGLTEPDSGQIQVRPGARISYMFQEPRLLPWCTALQNVVVGAQAADIPNAQDAACQVLEQVGLRAFADHYPAQLSGGMQQRVALARAMVVQPDVLLLDEPLSNVDEALKRHVLAVLQETIRVNASTVVYVTHDPLELQHVTTRILHLECGAVTNRDVID